MTLRSTTTADVRILTETDDIARASTLFRTAMVGFPLSAGGDVTELHEHGRTLGAFIDGELVGTAEAYSSWLTVPGGARVPHAAVTHIGVLPTHTRSGLLTTMMRRQLADIAARGEVVASLRASEAVIYERFGYAIASRAASFELARRRAQFRENLGDSGPVRLVDQVNARKLLPDIYDNVAWTGSIDRPAYWWNQRQLSASTATGPSHLAVHGTSGAEDGFVSYHPLNTAEWFGSRDRTVVVDDFVAISERAYLGLTRHLAALDLIDTVRLPLRPVDDPLQFLFTDARSARVTGVRDETWLRLIDVLAALQMRTYRPAGPLVLGISDDLLPANSGTYRIDAAGVRRSGEPADISTDVASLASAYLGGVRWRALSTAGRVLEHRPGALAAADELFATVTEPFSGTSF